VSDKCQRPGAARGTARRSRAACLAAFPRAALAPGSAGSRPAQRAGRGVTLLELLVVLVVLGLVAAASAGPIREGLARARHRSAAVELARRMTAARWRAVARGVSVGLRFEPDGRGWRVATYQDGDGDGIRSADIAAGRDRAIGDAFHPDEGRPGVQFGLPPGPPIPRVPPSRGWLRGGEDPIRFGRSDIVSFSPLGNVTPGTVYLTDPQGRLAAVVVFGATARIRVRFFDPGTGQWRP
jgi:prepilin-type N-terminal cleavage/methylation domain-containing protein